MGKKRMPDRVACCIPGCRRTRQNPGDIDEWICQRHWSPVPRQMRRAYASAKRRKKPWAARNRIWLRCKRAAINEHFMGL